MTEDVFPFFVGAGRSGTTLVRAMFDSHPELCIPGESGFITRLGRRVPNRYGPDGRFDTTAFLSDLLSHPRVSRWNLDAADLEVALERPKVTGYADAVRRVYSTYARSRGKPLYGDKTPVYVLHIPYLAGLFPEAKFVHIIRDGRDVALSHLSISEWGPGTIEEAAQEWKCSVLAGRRAGSNLDPGRYIEMRYEELVRNPEAALRPVCRALGLDFDDGMLRYFERVESILNPEFHPHHHGRLALPPTANLRDWRTQMRAEDVASFETVGGSTLHELGYEPALPNLPRTVRARAWLRLAGAWCRRAAKRARHSARKAWGSVRRSQQTSDGGLRAGLDREGI